MRVRRRISERKREQPWKQNRSRSAGALFKALEPPIYRCAGSKGTAARPPPRPASCPRGPKPRGRRGSTGRNRGPGARSIRVGVLSRRAHRRGFFPAVEDGGGRFSIVDDSGNSVQAGLAKIRASLGGAFDFQTTGRTPNRRKVRPFWPLSKAEGPRNPERGQRSRPRPPGESGRTAQRQGPAFVLPVQASNSGTCPGRPYCPTAANRRRRKSPTRPRPGS